MTRRATDYAVGPPGAVEGVSMETWVNIHTKETINVVGNELVSNPPIKVFIMEDGSRWRADDFVLHHQRPNTASSGRGLRSDNSQAQETAPPPTDVSDTERLHGWPLFVAWAIIVLFCALVWVGVILGAMAIWRYLFGV